MTQTTPRIATDLGRTIKAQDAYAALVAAIGVDFHPETEARYYNGHVIDGCGYSREAIDSIVNEAKAAQVDVYGIAYDVLGI